jgi:drug/metabolite transporter (DMT)-like permease
VNASIALALAASALLGTAVVLANVGLRYVDSARGALIAIPATTALYWLLALFLLRLDQWNAAALAIFAVVGVIFPAVVTLLGYESNRLAGPTITGTLASTTPLFAALGAVIFLGESLTPAVAGGTAAIVLGAVALTWRGTGRPQAWAPWVIALPLAGAAIRGGALTTVKAGLALWPDPFVAGLIGYTVSSATILAANRALPAGRRAAFDARAVPWLLAVGACNGMAVLAMYAALARGQVSVVSPLIVTYPLFTLAGSALFLRDERLDARVLFGVVATVAGVVVLARA